MRQPDHHRQERLNGAPANGAPVRSPRQRHVAALPFPTPQGTQAAIDAMLRALARAGRAPQLLAYPGGQPSAEPPPFMLHRGPAWASGGAPRSGPSLAKLLADLGLAARLHIGRPPALASELLIAHHVEAALVSWPCPAVFFAHTDLGAELPCYAPAWPRPLLTRAGAALDRLLIRRAAAVATVSPQLRERMVTLAGPRAARVRYVPIPWQPSRPITLDERAQARAQLGLPAGTQVVAYAGNLDAYQGWEALIAALVQLNARHPLLQLLVATASDPAPLRHAARAAGVGERVMAVRLDGEPTRRALHAAADAIAIPRRIAGGVPIKLLDALARGAPCAVARSAHAGLPLRDAALIAAGDDGPALAAALDVILTNSEHAQALRTRGREYIGREHGDAAFLTAFDAVCALASSPP